MSNSHAVEHSLLRKFLFIAFFLTGATGLVYQIIWSRLLVFSFGYTIYSISVVITAFMGGLALGSYFGGILADRIKNTVTAYAAAELGIGLIALLTYPLLMGLPRMVAGLRELLSIPYSGFSLWAFLISICVLVPPTFLMGLTLPLLSKALTRIKENSAIDIGTLYSVNTVGAAVGSVVAGFFLIALMGVYRTLLLAACVNILIGLMAIILNRSLKANEAPGARDEGAFSGASAASSVPLYREPIFWAFGVSGFSALAIEVVWIRIFAPYLENSTYAFALILGIFLLGIAIGGWAGRRVAARRADSVAGFGVCQLLVGLSTGVGVILLFVFVQHYYNILPKLGLLVVKPTIIIEQAVFIFAILFASTFFMGAGFPFIAQWAGSEFAKLGGRTGKLYAANTVGAIFGALAGGFLFLPLFGTSDTLIFLVVVNCLNGAVLVGLTRRSIKIPMKKLVVLAALLIVFISLLRGIPNPGIYAITKAYEKYRILAVREDPDVNVTLLERKSDATSRSLHINLRLVSGSGRELTLWMSNLPILLFNKPSTRILNIGLGYGVTYVTSLVHPGVKIDVVELIPSVAELFDEFNPYVKEAAETGRGSIIIGDGRNYLLSVEEAYDIVLIDPTPPLYGTGAVNLYTADFFQIVMEKLSEEGILFLRIPGSADYESTRLLIRTAMEVFPNVSLWSPPSGYKGISVIASNRDYDLSPAELERRVNEKEFFSVSMRETLLKYQPWMEIKGEALLEKLEKTPVVTDDRPYLEFPLFFEY
ncbi:MAG: fused MFS/spermidine synthase [Thermodesulfobacteriota bacterium]